MSGWRLRTPFLAIAAAAIVALGISGPAAAVPVAPAGAADILPMTIADPDLLILAGNGHPGSGGGYHGGWRGGGYHGGGYYNGWPRYRNRCRYYGCNSYYSGFYFGFPLWGTGPYYGDNYYSDDGYADNYAGDDSNAHVRWCLNRYRSYNPRTDTFMGYDGYRHLCRGPY